MLILGVIIEYAATSLDRPFSYAYNGNKIIKTRYTNKINYKNAKFRRGRTSI